MRRLTIIVATLAAIYSGYWFVGARAAENGALTAVDAMQSQGWGISYADLGTRGFPSRFDTTVTDLDLASPDGTFRYATPFAQLFALSYAPNEVIAALADTHELSLGGVPLSLTTDGLRASARVAASADLQFETATAEVGAVSLQIAGGPALHLASALAASRLTGPSPKDYDIYFEALGLTLPDQAMIILSPDGDLPATLPRIAIDAAASLDRPLDRHSIAEMPVTEAINLKSLDIRWGDMHLTGSGDLTADSQGYAKGTITLRATAWRLILRTMVNAGIIDPGVAPTWEAMGTALAQGNAELELPLTFSGGIASIGLFPVGPAPRLR